MFSLSLSLSLSVWLSVCLSLFMYACFELVFQVWKNMGLMSLSVRKLAFIETFQMKGMKCKWTVKHSHQVALALAVLNILIFILFINIIILYLLLLVVSISNVWTKQLTEVCSWGMAFAEIWWRKVKEGWCSISQILN